MSELENAILSSQENQIRREEEALLPPPPEPEPEPYREEDELGFVLNCPVKEMPDYALGEYLACRAFVRSKRLIHIHNGKIYVGHDKTPLAEDKRTLLRLAAYSYTRHGATAYAWEYLHDHLPVLHNSIIQVMPGLLFDRDTGEIIRTEGNELTI